MEEIKVGDVNGAMRALRKEKMDKLKVYEINELLNLDIKPIEWLIPWLLPHPCVTAWSGLFGSYKTFFTMWAMLRMSLVLPVFEKYETPFFGDNNPHPERIASLLIEEENGLRLTKSRIASLKSVGAQDVHYMVQQGIDFNDEQTVLGLIEWCREKNIKVVFFDAFSSMFKLKSENDNAEVAAKMKWVSQAFVNNEISLVFLHHPAKGAEGASLRGAGEITGRVDFHMAFEKQDDLSVRVTFEKVRVDDERKFKPFTMVLRGDGALEKEHFDFIEYEKDAMPPKDEEERKRVDMCTKIVNIFKDGKMHSQGEVAEGLGLMRQHRGFNMAWDWMVKKGYLSGGRNTGFEFIDEPEVDGKTP